MTDEFSLWMQTLDPLELAATNSFHSRAHREEMLRHELDKARRTVSESRFTRELRDIGEMWDARATPVVKAKRKATLAKRIKANPTYNFTEQQLAIAMKAEETK